MTYLYLIVLACLLSALGLDAAARAETLEQDP